MPIRQASFGSPDDMATFATSGQHVTAAAIVGAGVDYSVDDILTVIGGSEEASATLKVTGIGGSGDITGVSVDDGGAYFTPPTNPVSVAGPGSGATFNLTLTPSVTALTVVKTMKHEGRWYLFWYM